MGRMWLVKGRRPPAAPWDSIPSGRAGQHTESPLGVPYRGELNFSNRCVSNPSVLWCLSALQGRVHLASEDSVLTGDWSLVLEGVRHADVNMYECIVPGRRTLANVWLSVGESGREGGGRKRETEGERP